MDDDILMDPITQEHFSDVCKYSPLCVVRSVCFTLTIFLNYFSVDDEKLFNLIRGMYFLRVLLSLLKLSHYAS